MLKYLWYYKYCLIMYFNYAGGINQMKKFLYLMVALALLLALTACGAPSTETEDSTTEEAVTEAENDIVVFTDPVLESMVREAMGKPEGDITIVEAEAMAELHLDIEFQSPEEMRIKDITTLKYFVNLEQLELQFHAITDISPLAGLLKLRGLSLGGNQINDITALSGLTELGGLSLFNCAADDYSPLSNLTQIRSLFLEYSTISDLSALSGMKDLERLNLFETQVSDLSPLAVLTNLKSLYIGNCPIEDFTPIADIYPNLADKDFEM